MSISKRTFFPMAVGLFGAILMTSLFFGIISLAESPQHATEQFWEDRWIILPIIIGFGVQVGLYTILKLRLYIPAKAISTSGPMMGAGGTTSTIAMVACCAHHVTDVLPIIGITAAATFLAQYRVAFMLVGLGTTLSGILIMLHTLLKVRKKFIQTMAISEITPPNLETL